MERACLANLGLTWPSCLWHLPNTEYKLLDKGAFDSLLGLSITGRKEIAEGPCPRQSFSDVAGIESQYGFFSSDPMT